MTTEISFYENHVPDFAAAAMGRLYRSVFSTMPFLRIYGNAGNGMHTYVARREGGVHSVLLFEVRAQRVRVLNETVSLDAAEIECFASWVLKRFPQVNQVSFKAIHLTSDRFTLPFLRTRYSEDIVIALPDSPEAYRGTLGHSTRKNIKRYMNKLGRERPGWQHCVRSGEEITPQDVRAITEKSLREKSARSWKAITSAMSARITRATTTATSACSAATWPFAPA